MPIERITRLIKAMFFFAATITAIAGFTQEPRVVSPDVHADRTVTFNLRAPNAKQVDLMLEGAKPAQMTQGQNGIWSFTTEPLAPDYYGYSFVVDGARMMDPENHRIVPNLITPGNYVHVAGTPPQSWDTTDVPHGQVRRHFYKSTVVGDTREFFVYTPPDYDASGKQRYPVLYLLHGYSDDASGWTAVGRANFILDNLIAQGKAKPMIIVMPLGYGAPEIVTYGWGGLSDQELRKRNFDKFGPALLTEVIPQVEAAYRVSSDRTGRAIAGLSMGGAESLLNGLNNIDKFAWIGAFSSGAVPEFNTAFPKADAVSTSQLRLLWISCGTEDFLIQPNRDLKKWLKGRNINFTDIETPGAHTWMVWRRNLTEFAPLLFRDAVKK